VDPTPDQDEEFAGGSPLQALADGPAAGRVDLLTVVLQELGQAAGLPDEILTAALTPGVRTTQALDVVFAQAGGR
jgi:hypothetical protein